MNAAAVGSLSALRPPAPRGLKAPAAGRSFGALATVVVHLLVLGLVLFGPALGGGHKAAKGSGEAVLMIDISAGEKAEWTPPPALAKPVLPQPVVPIQPVVNVAFEQVGSTAITLRGSRDAAEVERPASDEILAFLRGLRGNWLRPSGTSRLFSCNVKINYQAGGMVSSVDVQKGCGSPQLVDSIERAVWKTRPLPFTTVPMRAGSFEIDFSP